MDKGEITVISSPSDGNIHRSLARKYSVSYQVGLIKDKRMLIDVDFNFSCGIVKLSNIENLFRSKGCEYVEKIFEFILSGGLYEAYPKVLFNNLKSRKTDCIDIYMDSYVSKARIFMLSITRRNPELIELVEKYFDKVVDWVKNYNSSNEIAVFSKTITIDACEAMRAK